MKTLTTTYHIEFRDGWSANSHFGREISARINAAGNEFRTLAEARTALNRHRREHGGSQPGRFDIVASDGRRWSCE